MNQLIGIASWIYLVSINGLEIFLMSYDKRQARRRHYRVSEATLLTIGILGGGVGGLISQQLVKHKTRKFRFYLCYLIGTFTAFAIIYFCHRK